MMKRNPNEVLNKDWITGGIRSMIEKTIGKGGGAVAKAVQKGAKKAVIKMMGAEVPPKDVLIVVCDGKSARLAAERTVEYAVSNGHKAWLVSADSYKNYKLKVLSNQNKVIVIGHHGITEEEKLHVVCKYGKCLGMTYGVSDRKCVLRAKREDLHSRTQFGEYYEHELSKRQDLAQQYAIPLKYIKEGKGKDRSTLESQYDLLWVIFAAEELPRFLGLDQAHPHSGSAEGTEKQSSGNLPEALDEQQPDICNAALLEQFKLEAPGSPYITADYLRQFCKRQQKFSFPSEASSQENCQQDVLLECGGWQIRRLGDGDPIGIFDPNGQCCVAGNEELILSPILGHIHALAKINALRMDHQLNCGIVLGGGGAKGAFQLGVWKWLEEHGGIDRFTGIAGASVGALNSLLFAQGDYSKAESLWMSMKDGDLVRPNKNLPKSIGKALFGRAFQGNTALNQYLLNVLTTVSSNLEKNAGLFSKKNYETIVRENISLEALQKKLTFVSLSAITMIDVQNLTGRDSALSAEYSYLDPQCVDPLEMNVRKVLASAAFPGAYTPVKIDGRLCIDGGALDNAPVFPLVNAGYRDILVIHLSRNREEFSKSLERTVPSEELEGVQLWHVWPQESLGNLFEINPELTQKRINAGYEAAAICLKDFLDKTSDHMLG